MAASPTRSRSDEDKFVAALGRKFRAVEIEPPANLPSPPPATSSPPLAERNRCALCRRTAKLVVGDDGRSWCREAEWDLCNRIAQGKLGASAGATSSASLSGVLEANGKCRDCGDPVRWVTTQRKKKVPCDVTPAPPDVAGFDLVGRSNTMAFYVSEKRRLMHKADVYEAHFNTCREGRDDGN